MTIRAIDRRGQEDTRLLTFSGNGEQGVRLTAAQPIDISRESNAELSLQIEYRVDAGPTGAVAVGMEGVSVPVTQALRGAAKNQWQTLTVPLRCFARAGAEMTKIGTPLVLKTSGKLTIAVSDVRLASAQVQQDRCSL